MKPETENKRNHKTIAVIGAGASGCFCAMLAADYGYNVLLIEHTDYIAKKILMTGNGKCNLSNKELKADCYVSDYKDKDIFLQHAFDVCGYEKTIAIFKKHGLFVKDKKELLYPASFQASSVTEFFLRQLKRKNIQILLKTSVKNIYKDNIFCIETSKNTYYADYVVLACGGRSYEKTGSDGSGFLLAKTLKHTVTDIYPALVKYVCKESFFKQISGLRADANVRLYVKDFILSVRGEVQLTDNGVSGIPVFQLSLLAGKTVSGIKGAIDFVWDMPEDELIRAIVDIKTVYADLNPEIVSPHALDALSGLVPKKLIKCVMEREGIDPFKVTELLTEKEIKRIARRLKNFDFTIKESAGYDNAQVTAGGVSLEEMTQSLESKIMPGLFMVGEMVDITGMCGGYNLQWAWTSAYLALVNGIINYENTNITN